MRILVIGNGGREHALVWKLAQSEKVTKIYCVPGNGGIESLAACVSLSVTDLDGLVRFAKEAGIDLTVVGPEVPLLEGIVDRFEAEGLRIFGPRKAAAQIEGSKRFAKELMVQYGIPTARFRSFTDAEQAKKYVREQGAPIVVKADGLAAGKGVVVAHSVEQAEQAIAQAMEKQVFGDAGKEVVIEEFLNGQEISLMAFLDGKTLQPMVAAQDHKPVYDHDQGPNTGGMGACSPVPQIPQHVIDQAIQTILLPTAEAFREEGIEYRGVLYAGLMVTPEGPKVIEFNARFGDPETQVVLPRLKTDLIDILLSVIGGRLADQKIEWNEEAAVCVVMAAGGYPGSYEKGKVIVGLPRDTRDQVVFHAGTKKADGQITTAGGRVLGVTALGSGIAEAREKAYQLVQQISFAQAHYRTDIAAKALK
ncbi:phosphoribosylamine--glycine ligase [Paenactinomyces guangxiensis]|uniref:Phosphoribosylamine--glycine ligase n=1 Tax=Paenactinomyces guangxiensis TaxID=1490290 RepID=A0A7W2A8C5_9BACL|nr:phosphoribosylamine--glycine ligase [Paenactinomyces guangxiensis]MBA4495481.1 phosphoribosylamine--glycine ligase [Paenactinomyces guangxiensis]MBH8592396.1 phosphoribosylamine--glycine ligase [Paenactinomyces guangxiensis]